jgi:hypothetical protein
MGAASVVGCFLLGFVLNHAFASHPVGGPITNGGWMPAWASCGGDGRALVFLPHEMISVRNGQVKHMRHHERVDILGDAAHPRVRMSAPTGTALTLDIAIDGDALRFTDYEFETGSTLWTTKRLPMFDKVLADYQSDQPYHRCPMPAGV